jgi:hypothetical protein
MPTKLKQSQLEDQTVSFGVERQLLLNPNFLVWQRGVSLTPNDDAFIADRWVLLTEAHSAWNCARYSDRGISMTCQIANNQGGIVQIVEGTDCKPYLGGKLSVAIEAYSLLSSISNIRCAVLGWGGTLDSVTSDVVSSWGQNGTNPTWATNWTMLNTPSNLALTTTKQTFKIENVSIPSSGCNNIAIVVWIDDGTIGAGDTVIIESVSVNKGEEALPFSSRSYNEELDLCKRFYQSRPDMGWSLGWYPEGADKVLLTIEIEREMRIPPVVTTTDRNGTINRLSIYNSAVGWSDNRTAALLYSILNKHFTLTVDLTGLSGFIVGKVYIINGGWKAEAEL